MPGTAVRLPRRFWIVRHGESAGNLAWARATAAGHPTIDIDMRDMDVPLSALGETQAAALGDWFRACSEPPDVVLSSPYLRARRTAEAVARALGAGDVVLDERLREREFGILDRLTQAGITARYPEQARQRAAVGKFYYRPPSGESWCDVLLRLRSAFDTICLRYADKRVLLVTHEVVVLCFRYLLESLSEAEVLAIDRKADVANCAVTEYAREGDALALQRYNALVALDEGNAPVTVEPPKRPHGHE